MNLPPGPRRHLVVAGLSLTALVALGCETAAPPTAPPTSAASQAPSPLGTPTPAPTETPIATPDPNADPNEAILGIETRGGRCVGGPCGNVVIVNRDGRVHVAAKPPNELGSVSPDLMAELDAAIRATDFDELLSHPFTGTCPTAVDGQELVVEILAPSGVQRIEGCAVEIDYQSPLFKAISAAAGEFVPLLNQ